MYKAMNIAQYIITKCTQDGSPISNLQLQKILYFTQGVCLAKNNHILFEENIFAWYIGPVVPNVYYRFCGYGASKILGRYPGIMIEKDTTVSYTHLDVYKRQAVVRDDGNTPTTLQPYIVSRYIFKIK